MNAFEDIVDKAIDEEPIEYDDDGILTLKESTCRIGVTFGPLARRRRRRSLEDLEAQLADSEVPVALNWTEDWGLLSSRFQIEFSGATHVVTAILRMAAVQFGDNCSSSIDVH